MKLQKKYKKSGHLDHISSSNNINKHFKSNSACSSPESPPSPSNEIIYQVEAKSVVGPDKDDDEGGGRFKSTRTACEIPVAINAPSETLIKEKLIKSISEREQLEKTCAYLRQVNQELVHKLETLSSRVADTTEKKMMPTEKEKEDTQLELEKHNLDRFRHEIRKRDDHIK